MSKEMLRTSPRTQKKVANEEAELLTFELFKKDQKAENPKLSAKSIDKMFADLSDEKKEVFLALNLLQIVFNVLLVIHEGFESANRKIEEQ